MTSKGCFFTALICTAILAFTLFSGISIFYQADKNYKKKIDRNGVVIKAVIVSKEKEKRNRKTKFKYIFKDKEYSNIESSKSLYNTVSPGDSIPIKVDTTAPQDAYVIGY